MTEYELISSKIDDFTDNPLASWKNSLHMKDRLIDQVKEYLSSSNIDIETALVWINSSIQEFDEEEKERPAKNEVINAEEIAKDAIGSIEAFRLFINGDSFVFGKMYRFPSRFYFATLKAYERNGEYGYILRYNDFIPDTYSYWSRKKRFTYIVQETKFSKEGLYERIIDEVGEYIDDYVRWEEDWVDDKL